MKFNLILVGTAHIIQLRTLYISSTVWSYCENTMVTLVVMRYQTILRPPQCQSCRNLVQWWHHKTASTAHP